MNWRARRQALTRFLWETDLQTLPPARAAVIFYARLAAAVVRDVAGGELRLQAMSLVYTSLLALIPLLAVMFSILKAFGAHALLEPMLLNFLAPLEAKGVELSRQILQFVSRMKVGVLGAVGTGLLLYVSASLLQKLEYSFNRIWQVRRGRRLVRRVGDYVAVIVIGPVFFFGALGVTASLASSAWLKPLPGVAAFAAKGLPYLLVIGGFWLVYVFIPNTRVRLRSALLGAAIAGVLWQSAGFAFTAFVAGSGQYRAVYASLAIIIFFIIWTYLSWLILLIGAAISHYHQHPERVTRETAEASALISNRKRERVGLLIARLIAEHHYSGRRPWSAEALARRLQQALPIVEALLAALVDRALLSRTRDEPAGYLPTCAPDTVPLHDVLEAIRAAGPESGPAPEDTTVDDVLERLQEARQRALAGRTWRDLASVETASAPATARRLSV